ncbi:MAG: hypothetical protein AB7H96_22965 [Vicinamibacterales bacterium]
MTLHIENIAPGAALARLRRPLAAVLLCAGLSLLTAPTASAQKHDPARAVIVFAGFGYFDATRHQWLSDLLERRAGLAAEGRELEGRVRDAAGKAFIAPASRWSTHQLVFDASTLAAAFRDATGRRDVEDPGEMLAAFEHVFVLVLTGGFEHHADQKVPSSRGVFHHPFTFASVNASLLDNASGTILLSTSTLSVRAGAAQLRDPGQSWGPHYRAVYAAAAEQALIRMQGLMAASDPREADKARDAYAVTGAVLAAGSSAGAFAASEFGWQAPTGAPPLTAVVGNACRPDVHCSSEGCEAMTGLLVSAVSESLSNRGYRVLPPVSWDEALLKTDSILRYKLSLPAEAMSGLMPITTIAFDPRRATNKTVAVLTGLGRSSHPDRNNITADDTYTASVGAQVFRTDPETCATLSSEPLSRKDGLGTETDKGRPLSAPLPDVESRQLLFLRAARRAAQGLAVR